MLIGILSINFETSYILLFKSSVLGGVRGFTRMLNLSLYEIFTLKIKFDVPLFSMI